MAEPEQFSSDELLEIDRDVREIGHAVAELRMVNDRLISGLANALVRIQALQELIETKIPVGSYLRTLPERPE